MTHIACAIRIGRSLSTVNVLKFRNLADI